MEDNKTFEVYKLVDRINNKIYVGSTTRGSGVRFKQHVTKAMSGSDEYPIHKAIREHGEENFNLSILEFCNSLEEMNAREAFYIAAFESTNPEIGYNNKVGGGVRFQSDASKKKIGDIHRGKVSDKRKPILQYDGYTGEFIQEYPSLSEAADVNQISRGSIIRVLNHKMQRPTKANPYVWIYKQDDKLIESHIEPKEYYINLDYTPVMSKECLAMRGSFISENGNFISLSKIVAKFDKDGNEIARYQSLAAAAKEEGNPSVTTIKSRIAKNTGEWKYVEDDRTDEEKKAMQDAYSRNAARLQGKKISLCDINGNEVKVIDTLSDAAKLAGNADRKTLSYHIKKGDFWRGYIWKYKD